MVIIKRSKVDAIVKARQKYRKEQKDRKLKELCTSTRILAYANYKKPFQLQTDASDFGLGAVLYQ